MTSRERAERIAKISTLPSLVKQAVSGLNDQQLDTTYRDGGWTVRQVVHHLADSHMNAFVRMKLILTEERPPLKGYSQDEWATLVDTKTLAIASSLAILSGLHERWTALLGTVNEAQWSRVGLHSERGDVTLESLLNTYAHHGEKHVGQIMNLRTIKGW
ncbi:MAG: YfiT family bacillithiol transferase [Bacteroidota bacterium]